MKLMNLTKTLTFFILYSVWYKSFYVNILKNQYLNEPWTNELSNYKKPILIATNDFWESKFYLKSKKNYFPGHPLF